MITLENLEDICTFHAWTPEQRAAGNEIRAKAKEFMRLQIETRDAGLALQSAIKSSEPRWKHYARSFPHSDHAYTDSSERIDFYPSELQNYADERRAKAVDMVERLTLSQNVLQDLLSAVNLLVMVANSAITFEARPPKKEIVPEAADADGKPYTGAKGGPYTGMSKKDLTA
jgi:hypothetical protein